MRSLGRFGKITHKNLKKKFMGYLMGKIFKFVLEISSWSHFKDNFILKK